jgi:uncharacterized protein YjiS (DUF1127 family)
MRQTMAIDPGASLHGRGTSATTPGAPARAVPPIVDLRPGTTHGPAASMAPPSRWRVQGLIDGIRRIAGVIRDRWVCSRTEVALQELDAHMLRDIGLDRSEIPSMAAEWHGIVPATRTRVLRHSP